MKSLFIIIFSMLFGVVYSQTNTMMLNLLETDTLKLSSMALDGHSAASWLYTDINSTVTDITLDTVYVLASDTLRIESFNSTNYVGIDRTIRIQYLDVNDNTGSFESLVWTTSQIVISDFFEWPGESTSFVPNPSNTLYQLFVEVVDNNNLGNVTTHIWRFFIKFAQTSGVPVHESVYDCNFKYYDFMGREIDKHRLKRSEMVLRRCGDHVSVWVVN